LLQNPTVLGLSPNRLEVSLNRLKASMNRLGSTKIIALSTRLQLNTFEQLSYSVRGGHSFVNFSLFSLPNSLVEQDLGRQDMLNLSKYFVMRGDISKIKLPAGAAFRAKPTRMI